MAPFETFYPYLGNFFIGKFLIVWFKTYILLHFITFYDVSNRPNPQTRPQTHEIELGKSI
jgi:hypothetical protein